MLADRWESLDEPNRRGRGRRADASAPTSSRAWWTGCSAPRSGTARPAGWCARSRSTRSRRCAGPPRSCRTSCAGRCGWSCPTASRRPAATRRSSTSIVAELVTNAVRLHPAATTRGPVVEVQAGADAHTVFVRVCDRGVGIDPADVERAFERFWRGPRATAAAWVGAVPGPAARRAAERLGVAASPRRRRDRRRGPPAPRGRPDGAPARQHVGCPLVSKRRRQRHRSGSGPRREKVRDIFVPRPFQGLADEPDWVALRELVPAATAPLRLAPELRTSTASARSRWRRCCRWRCRR